MAAIHPICSACWKKTAESSESIKDRGGLFYPRIGPQNPAIKEKQIRYKRENVNHHDGADSLISIVSPELPRYSPEFLRRRVANSITQCPRNFPELLCGIPGIGVPGIALR
jgi:hypothetical protein